MTETIRKTILLVEDTRSMAELYELCLKDGGYAVTSVAHGSEAIGILNYFRPSALVLDLMLPDTNGMAILEYAQKVYSEMPVIVVTASNSVNIAVEAMKKGATDFIVKPFLPERLITTVSNALERKALLEEVAELRQVVCQNQYYDFIGQSAPMQAIYRIIESVAASKASVFIKGESGTGKELAAQAIHKASPRNTKPFVALNCAAIPHELMESHLFGHVKGAFTGAIADNPGAARTAENGTLFLDEICEMPLDLQAKLLRFLQTGEVAPVGSVRTRIADVRILAATNRDPLTEMKNGNLREDLYYRLHVIPLEMPPLRDREEDVLVLARHFLARFNGEENRSFKDFSNEAASIFRRYDWPGNVRQLENVVRNVAVLHSGEIVTRDMLPADLHHFTEVSLWPANQNAEQDLVLSDLTDQHIKPLWQAEKDAILSALEHTNQDVTQAAALLEVSPSTLYRKLQAWKSQTEVA